MGRRAWQSRAGALPENEISRGAGGLNFDPTPVGILRYEKALTFLSIRAASSGKSPAGRTRSERGQRVKGRSLLAVHPRRRFLGGQVQFEVERERRLVEITDD